MGAFFSRIGSDPYYANYDRSLEALKTTTDKLQVHGPSKGQSAGPDFANSLVHL